jgi:hypothetical protein
VRVNIFDWAKDSLTKQAITLRFLGTIVNRFWFRNFTMAPFEHIFRARYRKADSVEVSDSCSRNNS